MAGGNGDERMQAVWEQVEAKLDRLGEQVDDIVGRLTAFERRVGALEDGMLRQAETLHRLTAVMETLARELAATRRRADLGFEMTDASFREIDARFRETNTRFDAKFQEMDARFDRLRDDILGGYAEASRRDLTAA